MRDINGGQIFDERACRVCGCTQDDCTQCVEASGEPCSWVAYDLCSRCKDEQLKAFKEDSEKKQKKYAAKRRRYNKKIKVHDVYAKED